MSDLPESFPLISFDYRCGLLKKVENLIEKVGPYIYIYHK
jgi:hypothetical protein